MIVIVDPIEIDVGMITVQIEVLQILRRRSLTRIWNKFYKIRCFLFHIIEILQLSINILRYALTDDRY